MYKFLLPLALLAAPSIALADGYEGSAKDGGYAYSYTVKQTRWACPREFSRKECQRIQGEIAKRRARVERLRGSAAPETDNSGNRIGRITVVGGQRPTEGLARGAAWKEWRSVVRATGGGGEAYMDDRFAIGERVTCHITGSGGFLKRCEVSAVPCR